MAWRVRWAAPAWENLQAAAAYIALDSPRYATALIQDARDAARSLRQFPRRGRIVPEEDNPALRELFVFRQRYRMLYEIVDGTGEVIILAFIHGARDLKTAHDENE